MVAPTLGRALEQDGCSERGKVEVVGVFGASKLLK
jgi:hypothetical protein